VRQAHRPHRFLTEAGFEWSGAGARKNEHRVALRARR